MAKTEYDDWSTTAGSNTDIGGINIAENCAAANINDALREMMAQLKDHQIIGLGPDGASGAREDLELINISDDGIKDTVWTYGNLDDTKKFRINVDNLPTATTVAWDVPSDASGTEEFVGTEAEQTLENKTLAGVEVTGEFYVSGTTLAKMEPVYDNTTAAVANVFVGNQGGLLRSTSTGKFKTERHEVDTTGFPDLKACSFKSTHESDGGRRFIGFIAEHVAEAFPEASVDDGQNYDTRALLAVLWTRVQEQEERINALEAGE